MKNRKTISVFTALMLFSTIVFASYISPPQPVSKGGTGAVSFTANGMVYGGGTSPLGVTGAGSQYQTFQAGASGVPTVGALQLAQSAATSGLLLNSRGGTGFDSSSSTGIAHVSGGTWSFSAVDLSSSDVTGNLAPSHLNSGTNASASTVWFGDGSWKSPASAPLTVTNGGDASYTILSTDNEVRSGTTLTGSHTYTLPTCNASNIGEKHYVKNLPAQTFTIVVAAAGSDTVDGNASYTLNPGDSVEVVCGAFSSVGTWDVL